MGKCLENMIFSKKPVALGQKVLMHVGLRHLYLAQCNAEKEGSLKEIGFEFFQLSKLYEESIYFIGHLSKVLE